MNLNTNPDPKINLLPSLPAFRGFEGLGFNEIFQFQVQCCVWAKNGLQRLASWIEPERLIIWECALVCVVIRVGDITLNLAINKVEGLSFSPVPEKLVGFWAGVLGCGSAFQHIIVGLKGSLPDRVLLRAKVHTVLARYN